MIQSLPKWYTDAKEQIDEVINKIALENNLKFYFVRNSKTIEDCKEAILMDLVFINENAYPEARQIETRELIKLKKSVNRRKDGK